MPRRVCVVAAGVALTASAASAWERSPVPFAETAQIKLTYQGPQQEPIPTLAFTTESQSIERNRFTPYQHQAERELGLVRPWASYDNDALALETVRLIPDVMRRVLIAFYETDFSRVSGESVMSAIIVWKDLQGETGQEYLMSLEELRRLFPAMQEAVQGGPDTPNARALRSWGCALGLTLSTEPCR